jgi:hypothetical protein
MRKYIGLFIAIGFLCISVVYANQIKNNKIRVFENCYVSYIDEEKLFIDGEEYILSPDLIITENQDCKIDKKTIAGVGFISKADVTIREVRIGDKVVNEVVEIVILEMQQ